MDQTPPAAVVSARSHFDPSLVLIDQQIMPKRWDGLIGPALAAMITLGRALREHLGHDHRRLDFCCLTGKFAAHDDYVRVHDVPRGRCHLEVAREHLATAAL